jgi:hypothetical protein
MKSHRRFHRSRSGRPSAYASTPRQPQYLIAEAAARTIKRETPMGTLAGNTPQRKPQTQLPCHTTPLRRSDDASARRPSDEAPPRQSPWLGLARDVRDLCWDLAFRRRDRSTIYRSQRSGGSSPTRSPHHGRNQSLCLCRRHCRTTSAHDRGTSPSLVQCATGDDSKPKLLAGKPTGPHLFARNLGFEE